MVIWVTRLKTKKQKNSKPNNKRIAPLLHYIHSTGNISTFINNNCLYKWFHSSDIFTRKTFLLRYYTLKHQQVWYTYIIFFSSRGAILSYSEFRFESIKWKRKIMIFSDCYVTDFRFQQAPLKQWLVQTKGSFNVFPPEHRLLTTLWSTYS